MAANKKMRWKLGIELVQAVGHLAAKNNCLSSLYLAVGRGIILSVRVFNLGV